MKGTTTIELEEFIRLYESEKELKELIERIKVERKELIKERLQIGQDILCLAEHISTLRLAISLDDILHNMKRLSENGLFMQLIYTEIKVQGKTFNTLVPKNL